MDPDEIANSTFEEESQSTPASGRRNMQKPDNVPDYLWEDYLYAWQAYQESQSRLANADWETEEQAAKDVQAARSLLSTIITQMDNFQKTAVSPEDKALERRYKEAQITNLNRGPQGRQLTSAELKSQEQQVAMNELDIQKKQQGLENPYTQKMKYINDAYKKINDLQQMMIRGEIEQKDADQQIKTFQDWIQADMMGATPFQMQKDTRDFNYKKEEDRRKLASDVLGTRAQAGTSLANGLMNSLFGAYGKMYSGANPNYNIDYFGMVKGLTDEVTGGQDLNELGMAILKGAFSPKGGW